MTNQNQNKPIQIPLICDAVPGASEIFVLTVKQIPTVEQADRIRKAFDEAMARPGPRVFVLEEGMKLEQVGSARQWPDAEFCAA